MYKVIHVCTVCHTRVLTEKILYCWGHINVMVCGCVVDIVMSTWHKEGFCIRVA